MKIAQKYSRAVTSSNLKCDCDHHATDTLAAVALSSELGSQIYRVKYCNDSTSFYSLLTKFIEIVGRKAKQSGWHESISPTVVATTALTYWLNDICEFCEGRGYDKIPGTPMLSDEPCEACRGSAKKPIVADRRIIGHVRDMVALLGDLESEAGSGAIRRLAAEF